jgi:ATP adenylyltransferase
MDYLWTPWRYRYIADPHKDDGCIFCDAVTAGDDAKALIVLRGVKSYIILNAFPYTTGHLMVVPYVHVADLAAVEHDTLAEMMLLAQKAKSALEHTYHPDGYNLGMNLGRAAGAGVTGHLHLHVLPRWSGDANFMTVVGETRVEPEELSTTYAKLKKAFDALAS